MNPTYQTSPFDVPFSANAGIAIQQRQLAQWSQVLNAETFLQLFREATKNNGKARSGYDVCRGDTLDAIVNKLARP